MALPDLITSDYATAQLSAGGRALTTAQAAALASKITEASTMVRRWCGDRDFTRGTYDESHRPELDGTVMLRQFPVNRVMRVSGGRTAGITIANSDPANNLRPTVGFTSTGDEAAGITWTGLALMATAGGVDVEVDITFASSATLGLLAAAVNAVGSGWSATVPSNLVNWPSADLVGGDVAGDASGSGAALEVYAEVLANCRLDRRTGELTTGIGGGGSCYDGPRWGPYQDPLDDGLTSRRVRVLYDAGFDTIPEPIQQATAIYVGKMLDDLTRDLGVTSETAGAGSYTVDGARAPDFPPECLVKMAPYRITRT